MRHPLADHDRQQRIGLLIALGVGSVMLWQTTLGAFVLYPFTILATWFHEMGHGIVAMATGANFDRLLIFADGSGLALSSRQGGGSRLLDALVAAGGPLGPAVAGSALIIASRSHRATRFALSALGGALLLSTLIWVRSPAGMIVLPLLGLLTLWIARSARPQQQRFAIQFLGVQACISVWQQFSYLFTAGGSVGGQVQRSDTAAIAELLLLPYWVWGIVISVAIVALMWRSFLIALRR